MNESMIMKAIKNTCFNALHSFVPYYILYISQVIQDVLNKIEYEKLGEGARL